MLLLIIISFHYVFRLICKPEVRLGKGGATELLKHPYFSKIDIPNIRKKQPPFVPRLSSDEDLSYFDVDSTVVLESQNEKMSSPRSMDKNITVQNFNHERSSPNNSTGSASSSAVKPVKRGSDSPSSTPSSSFSDFPGKQH